MATIQSISLRMRHVKSNRGKSEVMLSKALWKKGLRYRLNFRILPGCPDIAITKYKIAIFVDGELWHGYNWEQQKAKWKSNREYWIPKIEANITRDMRNDQLLSSMGWQVIHFWDKEVKRNLEKCVNTVFEAIRDSNIVISDDMYLF